MEQELENEELLEQFPCAEKNPGVQGVLLSDQIERFATNPEFKLISPFNPDRLKPAGYELTIGEDYYIGGEFKKLEDKPGKNLIEIPPFEVVIISTYETINLPRFLIARWNLRVIWAYQGLLWLGALQVDPGWVGRLYCPIFNLSNKIVKLGFKEPIALMDFVTTTPFNEKSKKYDRPPKRKSIRNYTEDLKSALFTQAGQRLDKIEDGFSKFKTDVKSDINISSTKLENKVNEFEKKIDTYIGIIFTSIAVLIAALSIIATSNPKDTKSILSPSIWLIIPVIFSIVAFIFASSAFFAKRHIESIDITEKIKQIERAIWLVAIAILVLAVAVVLIIWMKVYG